MGKLTDSEITTWLDRRYVLAAIEEDKGKVCVLDAGGTFRPFDEIDAAEALRQLTMPRAARPKGYEVRPMQFKRALLAAAGGRHAWLSIARGYPEIMAFLDRWEGLASREDRAEGVPRLWTSEGTWRAVDAYRREAIEEEAATIKPEIMLCCIRAHAWRRLTGEAIEGATAIPGTRNKGEERPAKPEGRHARTPIAAIVGNGPPRPIPAAPRPKKRDGSAAAMLRARAFIRLRFDRLAFDRAERAIMVLIGRSWREWRKDDAKAAIADMRKNGGPVIEPSDFQELLRSEAARVDYRAELAAAREEVRVFLRKNRRLAIGPGGMIVIEEGGNWRAWRNRDTVAMLDLLRTMQIPRAFDISEADFLLALAGVAEEARPSNRASGPGVDSEHWRGG